MKRKIPEYWIYQMVGWGLFVFITLFFAVTFHRVNNWFIIKLMIVAGLGALFSHIMRYAIKQSNVLLKPLNQQLIGFIVITMVFSFAVSSVETWLTDILHLRNEQDEDTPRLEMIMYNAFYSFIYLFIWNCIYFIYHYIQKSRKQQMDTLKLEALVKELELKTIKAHINPHFIFNALNSIRALIDENPVRARTAITELSNILRSSMKSEKAETVPFEKELGTVKDYLALEHIRFEERLQVEYRIDEDTLDQPVPPMMLQILVENAIKHGINKQVDGGMIKIISDFKDDYHELLVQNTGCLQNPLNSDGFGLASTQNRLQLMFGEKAHFQINEINGNTVEAKIQIPIIG